MTNAEKIKQFDDEQLARFLWIWKINSVITFLTQGGMNAKDMREWLDQTTDTFICTETFVGDDYTFDQDFKDKQADTPQTESQRNSEKVKGTPQTESTGSPIGDYRDGVGAWQTDCPWK